MDAMKRILLVLGFGILFSGLAQAQYPQYPNRSIRILVPFTPGTGIDILARVFGQTLAAFRSCPSAPMSPPSTRQARRESSSATCRSLSPRH